MELMPAQLVHRAQYGNGPVVRTGTLTHDGVALIDVRVWPDPAHEGQLGVGKGLRVPATCLPAMIDALEALRPAVETEAAA